MSWAADINKLTKKGGHDLHELAKAIKIGLFSGVVLDTRFVTGRLRGNWQIQENTPARGVLERLDKSGSAVTSEIESKATGSGLTYFTNNLPYARVFEEKDAMVARNVVRVMADIKNMAKAIK